MMTLLQMANFITGKVGQYDSVSLALCKDYLRARYQMVWDSNFWRDTQIVSPRSLAAGVNTFSTPSVMERVVTIGNSDGILLDPVDESFLLEADPSVLNSTEIPRYYIEIPGADPADSEDLPDVPPPPRWVIKVYPTPDKTTTFSLFGKRACSGFANDSSVSVLRNCDNAIIAFAMGDMLERLRQYGKAQAKFQEAKELLEEAKSVERNQSNRPRQNKNLTVVGNSLSEMTDAVCGICGMWTPDVRIIVREFLRRNYVALYQMTLWPESTVVVRVASIGEQVILPHYVDRVLAARTGDGFRLMPNEVSYLFGVSPIIFESTGTPISMSILTPVGVGTLPLAPPEALSIGSSDVRDSGRHVFIRGESGGTEVTEDVILEAPATPVTTRFAYDVPLTVSKPVTLGDVSINGAVTSQLYELLPAEERERKHQRVWLLPAPVMPASSISESPVPAVVDCAQGLLVLGKRQITPLRTDEDTPIITGAQGVLIAAAAADLFTRMGNNDSAQIYRTRADVSSKVLLSENTDQSAYQPKIVPMLEPRSLGIEDAGYCWSKE